MLSRSLDNVGTKAAGYGLRRVVPWFLAQAQSLADLGEG